MPVNGLRSGWMRTLSAQLGNPSGPLGWIVAAKLNKNNRGPIEAAVSALGPLEDAAVADIGFGGGIGLELLLGASPRGVVHGVEPSRSMNERARRKFRRQAASGRLVLHAAAMDNLPFEDGQLDGWISLNTLYFIDDLGSSLAEVARVLAADGLGVFGVADPDWLGNQPFAQQGFRIRSLGDLTAQIESAGLVVDVENVGGERPYHLLVCRRSPLDLSGSS